MMDSSSPEPVPDTVVFASEEKSTVASAATGVVSKEEVAALPESNKAPHDKAKSLDVEANWTGKQLNDMAENAIPMPHVAKVVCLANEQHTDVEAEVNQGPQVPGVSEENPCTVLGEVQSVLPNAVPHPSLTFKSNNPGIQAGATAVSVLDSYALPFNVPSPTQLPEVSKNGFLSSWTPLGKALENIPMIDGWASSHDTEFEPDNLQVETIVEKSFTVARKVLGVRADPSKYSGKVRIFGVDEVINKMKITKMEKHFLLTRWMKARNSQKHKAKTNANYFRLIGLAKVLCGVLVPVIISTFGTVPKGSTWNTILANTSIVLSVLGTFATALEDFFQFGVRAANRTTCLSKLDRIFWEFQGMGGQFEEHQEQSGHAFKLFAFACEQHVFMVEDLHLSSMFSSDEKDKNAQQKPDKQASPSFKEAAANS